MLEKEVHEAIERVKKEIKPKVSCVYSYVSRFPVENKEAMLTKHIDM
jgi:hypothetical protein